MTTSSRYPGAMGLAVQAVERRRDFDEAAMTLRRARDEAKALAEARLAGRAQALQSVTPPEAPREA